MRVLILGGGISGLSAAWYAHAAHPEAQITVLEASSRLGGLVGTEEHEGFLFERSARTFAAARSPRLLKLISDLGLESELLFSDPNAERRFLWKRGALRPLSSFWPLFVEALIRDQFAPQALSDEETIFEFATRRFGKRFAETVIDPMVLGIFGGDLRQLSLGSTIPSLQKWEQEGSVLKGWLRHRTKGKRGLFRLRGGMGSLIRALAVLPIEIHTSTPVKALTAKGAIANGREYEADLIVSALPVEALSRLAGVASPLSSIWVQVVNLGYRDAVHWPYQGYGYLVPTEEQEPLLGMVWDRCIFPTVSEGQVTAMVRGEEKGGAIAIEAMGRHLKKRGPPQALWVTKGEIPQYTVGHAHRMTHFKEALSILFPKLRLAGNYLEGVSVEACLSSSSKIFTIS